MAILVLTDKGVTEVGATEVEAAIPHVSQMVAFTEVFNEPSNGGDLNRIHAIAMKQPGRLLANGLVLMRKYSDPTTHVLEGTK